jgi:hypothetical protein
MKKMKQWPCDFKNCCEIATWYRRWKGDLLKLCTKHEAYMRGKHYGRSVNESELDREDMAYLFEKAEKKERSKEVDLEE